MATPTRHTIALYIVSDSLYLHPLEHTNSFYFMTAFTDFGDSAESNHFYSIINNPLTLPHNTFFDSLTLIPKHECPYIQELLATTAPRARMAMEQNDFATLPSSQRTTKQTSMHCVMTSRLIISSDFSTLTASASYWRSPPKFRYSTDFEHMDSILQPMPLPDSTRHGLHWAE
jgi:hypothetical protein